MELTFVHQYSDSPPKRRRLAKACDLCRSRKKRCRHYPGAILEESNGDKADGDDDAEDGEVNGHLPRRVISTPPIRKFVSDLNPEATFLPRHDPVTGHERPPNDDIGVWVDRSEYDEFVRQKNSKLASELSSGDNHKPDPAVIDPLIDIYFHRVHPILPLLDEPDFRHSRTSGRASDTLTLAICLVAAKDVQAESYLRLAGSTTILQPREFCSRIHSTVMAGLRYPSRFEKITLIRALALASLHAEGQDGHEEATMCLTQAMHYTQTLGWHLGQQASVASGDDLTTKRLFWCLWGLDRLHSAIYSRPIMMSDIDVAIEQFEPDESGFPAFEAWLRVCQMLNKIISFYRPGNPLSVTGWEEDWPSFEELAGEGKVWDLPQPTLATLHLFYLLVAILSHRSRGVKYMPRGLASYVRRNLASLEIQRLMSSSFRPSSTTAATITTSSPTASTTPSLFSTLLPLPIIPYAVSLALSVSYQHLRQAQLRYQQEDARNDFRLCCQVLQTLRRTWSSADVIATIARKVLAELEKAGDLASFRVSRYSGVVDESPCTGSLVKPLFERVEEGEREAGNGVEVVGVNVGGEQVGHGGQQVGGVNGAASETLFDGMDDIFGTYLDPNYPLYLDDFAFGQEISPPTVVATMPG